MPYVTDLQPVRQVTELSIRHDGHLLYSRSYVITPGGDQVLIRSVEASRIETVEAFPAE